MQQKIQVQKINDRDRLMNVLYYASGEHPVVAVSQQIYNYFFFRFLSKRLSVVNEF